VTRDEIANYGAWAAIFGGGGTYLVLLGLDLVGNWSLPFPYSLFWLVAAGLPAAGVATLFLLAQADRSGEITDAPDEPGENPQEGED
jgi:hypothetical protein